MSAVALVTGAAGGIGAAVVRRLSNGGARCVLVDRDEDGVARLAKEVDGAPLAADLTDPAASEAAVRLARDRFGRLDLVHLNAGATTSAPDPAALDLAEYRAVVGVNMDAVFYGVRAALPALRSTGGGAIVITASLAGLVGYAADPVYTMTKHAVVGLVRALAPGLAAEGVRLSAVCPGFTDTPMVAASREVFAAAGFPLLTPDDVAAAVEAAFYTEDLGELVVVQPGRPPLAYRTPGVPGPRGENAEGRRPPELGGTRG
ncbi:SDR family oxidoreductase [Bailinhaonella thermotolerans]|uniref:SDR family NAD(P)-dependent oxidoreductase n=1 Tax=Bailinhaonella thermotolerans TaxID=1070861 RepID=A0A3A4AVB3_9ACTN|nr:SDR family NAD(P)-dependent oxidoreductase [Bailinhaonella thermotolerans]RJL32651.1 SDR family NAD(P)-dependent oxidoreductase [Bailinhaonella thermotolerans]